MNEKIVMFSDDVSEKTIDFKYILFELGLLVLFVSSFFYFNHTSYVLFMLFSVCIVKLFYERKIKLDIRTCLATSSLIILRWIAFEKGASFIVNVGIPILFMSYSELFIDDDKRLISNKVKRIIYSLSYGLFAELLFSVAAYYRDANEGINYLGHRSWHSFFYYQELPANSYEFFGLLIMSLFFYGLYLLRKNFVQALFIILASVGSLVFLFFIITQRTVIILFVLSLLSAVFLLLSNRFGMKKAILFIGLAVAGLALAFYLVVSFNIFDLKNFMQAVRWDRDGGILNNVRIDVYANVIKQMVKYPMGGEKIDLMGLTAAHNFWLDIAYEAGIAPFILMVVFTIISFKDLITFIGNKEIDSEIKYMLVPMYIMVFGWLLVESVVKGSILPISVWLMICMIIARINKIYIVENTNEENENI